MIIVVIRVLPSLNLSLSLSLSPSDINDVCICCPTRPPWSPCLSNGARTSWRSSFKLDSLDTASGAWGLLSWHCVVSFGFFSKQPAFGAWVTQFLDSFPGWKLTFGSIWVVSECLFDSYLATFPCNIEQHGLQMRSLFCAHDPGRMAARPHTSTSTSDDAAHHPGSIPSHLRHVQLGRRRQRKAEAWRQVITAGCTNSGQLPGSQETCLGWPGCNLKKK